jgi:two-component system LytT family response regulator
MSRKAIIIDDEPHCRNVIARILEEHCADVKVEAECCDGVEGLAAILRHHPEIVFLDVEMPRMNGFQMLEALEPEDLDFALIFTTAYDKFAVKAFKYSAFNYLLKPIDDMELVATIQKLHRTGTPVSQLQYLKSNFHNPTAFNKLTIATQRGITFIELEDIIALEADSNYTKIHLQNGEAVLASKTLGYFDELLDERKVFFRTHKQFIVNLNFIKEYIAGDFSVVVLRNGLQAKLARTRREAFLDLFRV